MHCLLARRDILKLVVLSVAAAAVQRIAQATGEVKPPTGAVIRTCWKTCGSRLWRAERHSFTTSMTAEERQAKEEI